MDASALVKLARDEQHTKDLRDVRRAAAALEGGLLVVSPGLD